MEKKEKVKYLEDAIPELQSAEMLLEIRPDDKQIDKAHEYVTKAKVKINHVLTFERTG